MKLKLAVFGLLITSALTPAMADNQTIDLSSGYASFGSTAPLLAGGDDVISFINLAAGTYDFAVSFTGQYITDLAGSVGAQPLAVNSFNVFRFGYLEGTTSSPFALTLTGSTITSPLASYAVTVSVTAVPEPETAALLLAGLGAVGFAVRRRASA